MCSSLRPGEQADALETGLEGEARHRGGARRGAQAGAGAFRSRYGGHLRAGNVGGGGGRLGALLACVARRVHDDRNMADTVACEVSKACGTRTFVAMTLHEVPVVTQGVVSGTTVLSDVLVERNRISIER